MRTLISANIFLVATLICARTCLAQPDSIPLATQNLCQILMEGLAAAHQLKTVESGSLDTFEDEPSVEEVKLLDGRHGGKRILLKRIGENWGSKFATAVDAPQGDPRHFIETVGKETAEYFGFEILSSTEILVPDHTEFVAAIDKINRQLIKQNKEGILINFYSASDNQNAQPFNYIAHFRDHQQLPMALDGTHRLHDLSFHTGAIFLPKFFVDQILAHLEFVKDFFIYLVRKHSEQPVELEAAKSYRQIFHNIYTSQIDQITGTISYEIVYRHQKIISPDLEEEFEIAHLALNKGVSSTEAMIHGLEESRVYAILYGRTIYQLFNRIRQAIHPAELIKEIEQFSRSYQSKLFPSFNPNQIPSSSGVHEDLCTAVTQKRLDVVHAVQELNRLQE